MNWRGTAAAATVLLVGASGVSHFVDPDIWHSMSLARETLALGRVPLDDTFAYTPTVSPVVHHEWLWGMLLYGLGLHGGIAALQALRVAGLVRTNAGRTGDQQQHRQREGQPHARLLTARRRRRAHARYV